MTIELPDTLGFNKEQPPVVSTSAYDEAIKLVNLRAQVLGQAQHNPAMNAAAFYSGGIGLSSMMGGDGLGHLAYNNAVAPLIQESLSQYNVTTSGPEILLSQQTLEIILRETSLVKEFFKTNPAYTTYSIRPSLNNGTFQGIIVTQTK